MNPGPPPVNYADPTLAESSDKGGCAVGVLIALSLVVTVAGACIWFWFEMETTEVSLTVTNRSRDVLTTLHFTADVGPNPVIDFGTLKPGEQRLRSYRATHTLGGIYFDAAGRVINYHQSLGFLLSGKGARDIKIIIRDDKVDVTDTR